MKKSFYLCGNGLEIRAILAVRRSVVLLLNLNSEGKFEIVAWDSEAPESVMRRVMLPLPAAESAGNNNVGNFFFMSDVVMISIGEDVFFFKISV